jgi:hypothetical protein
VNRGKGVGDVPDRPGLTAPVHAVTAAVGVTAALSIVDAPDIKSAGGAMRWLVTGARNCGLSISATNIGWRAKEPPRY